MGVASERQDQWLNRSLNLVISSYADRVVTAAIGPENSQQKHPLPPPGLSHTSIRTTLHHPIGKPHTLRASSLLNEPPPLMDQKDAALGLALRLGERGPDGSPIGQLGPQRLVIPQKSRVKSGG